MKTYQSILQPHLKRILLILTLLIFIGKTAQAILVMPVTTEITQDADMDDDAEKESKKEKKENYDDLLSGSYLPPAGLCTKMFTQAGPDFFATPLLELHVPPPDNR